MPLAPKDHLWAHMVERSRSYFLSHRGDAPIGRPTNHPQSQCMSCRPQYFVLRVFVPRSAASGNPRFYTTFRNEGFNAEIAEMARASHRVRLEETVLARAALQAASGPKVARQRRRRLKL